MWVCLWQYIGAFLIAFLGSSTNSSTWIILLLFVAAQAMDKQQGTNDNQMVFVHVLRNQQHLVAKALGNSDLTESVD